MNLCVLRLPGWRGGEEDHCNVPRVVYVLSFAFFTRSPMRAGSFLFVVENRPLRSSGSFRV